MIYDELKTGLKIYSALEKQNRYLKESNVDIYQLITPKDTPLPFQFRVNSITSNITSWKIVTHTGAAAYDLFPYISNIEKKVTTAGKSYFIYKGNRISGFTMASGYYYMMITVGDVIFYSEVFYVPCDSFSVDVVTVPYLKLQWWNSCDLNGTIMYQTGFKNTLYLDADIFNEAPTIDEEGDEDGLGNFIPESQRFVSNLSLELLVPYYLGDSLTAMAVHNSVQITTRNNVYSGVIRDLKPTLAEEANTNLYLYTLKFQQDTEYFSTSCCNNIELI